MIKHALLASLYQHSRNLKGVGVIINLVYMISLSSTGYAFVGFYMRENLFRPSQNQFSAHSCDLAWCTIFMYMQFV